jgi:hypothetical protein
MLVGECLGLKKFYKSIAFKFYINNKNHNANVDMSKERLNLFLLKTMNTKRKEETIK